MRGKRSSPLVLLLLIFVVFCSQSVQAIGVQPMVLDFEGYPGERYQFELTIFPEDRQRVVHLGLYQPIQDLDGSVSFMEADTDLYPSLSWVQFESDRVVVPPGAPTVVRGEVTIPFSAGGSYSAIIMVEPAVADAEEGITVIVRYAIRLTVRVERPGLRSELQILSTELVPDDEGRPMLQVRVKNPSRFRFPVFGEATIRDEGRRLVERVTLRTLSAWESGHDSYAIYPETELLLVAPISASLYAGQFHLQNFLSYDTNKQLIRGSEVTVEAGQFAIFKDLTLSVGPETLDSTIKLGAATTHIIQLDNRKDEQLYVEIMPEDVETDYTRSVFEHLEVELRGEPSFSVEAKRSARSVLLIRVPRDVEQGGYYGNVNVHVFSANEDYLETHTIPLNVLVGSDWERSVDLRSLVVANQEAEYLFSVALSNSGNVHLKPRGMIQLRDENGDSVSVINLETPDGQQSLLPGMDGFLAGVIQQGNILPGSYVATVLAFEDQERIGIAEFPIVIE